MTRCEICEAELPDIRDPAFFMQRNRAITWFGRGPFVLCAKHSLDEALLWVAETLICNAEMARRQHELLTADHTAIYDLDGLPVEVTLPRGDGTRLERSVRITLDQGVAE